MILVKLKRMVTSIALLCIAGAAVAKINFVPNQGQWDGPFQYKANLGGGAMFFDASTIYVSLLDPKQFAKWKAEQRKNNDTASKENSTIVSGHAYRIDFLNANTEQVSGDDKQSNYDNYFLGDKPERWKGHVPVYQGLHYKQMYPGIDLVYFNSAEKLKYEFRAAAYANTDAIKMKYTGAEVKIDDKGNLVVHTTVGDVMEEAPYTYQMIDGRKVTVPSAFELKGDVVSYVFPQGYNKNYALVIDPVVVYKTYSGATNPDIITACGTTYDTDGRMCSLTQGVELGWPTTTGAFQVAPSPGPNTMDLDIAMSIYTPDGSGLIYSTYLGGGGNEEAISSKFNSLHQLIIVGRSLSRDYPTTPGCIRGPQPLHQFNEAIITVLSPNGTQLIGSTYFGSFRDDRATSVAIADSNSIYVGGFVRTVSINPNQNFPMPANAFQPVPTQSFDEFFVIRVNTACTQLLAGTYFGGATMPLTVTDGGTINDIIRDPATGDVIVAGTTITQIFPTTPGALGQPTVPSPGVIYFPDGFISRFDGGLTQLLSSTCLQREVKSLDLDPQGNIYAFGLTRNNTPVAISPNVYSNPTGDAFLMKINPGLTNILLATRLGYNVPGTPGFNFEAKAMKRSDCGHFYLCMRAPFGNMDVTPNAFSAAPVSLLYLAELGPDFSSLLFGSWIGRSVEEFIHEDAHLDFDPKGKIYLNTTTDSLTWWGTPGAWRTVSSTTSTAAPINDLASIVILMDPASSPGGFTVAPNDTLCLGEPFSFSATAASVQANISWNFGDGATAANTVAVNHTYNAPGMYKVLFSAIDSITACRVASKDSMLVRVNAPDSISVFPQDTFRCATEGLINVNVMGGAKFHWTPGSFVSDSTAASTAVTHLGESNLTVNITDAGGCKSTRSVHITQHHVLADAGPAKILRRGESVTLEGQNSIGDTIRWNASPSLSSLTDLTPDANPPVTTWYKIVAKSGVCEAIDSVKVTVAGFGIPNAFSPNGDGLNDIFRLENIDADVVKGVLSIYNRYGERVFHSEDLSKGWDGFYKGRYCDLGTYYYSAKVRIGDKEESFKGDITLMR